MEIHGFISTIRKHQKVQADSREWVDELGLLITYEEILFPISYQCNFETQI